MLYTGCFFSETNQEVVLHRTIVFLVLDTFSRFSETPTRIASIVILDCILGMFLVLLGFG